jgi:tRNA threonylcarbamoyl adenosine modification protein YeaZ
MECYILSLDSSYETYSIALSNKQKILYNFTEYKPSRAAEMLVPEVMECLKRTSINFQQINYLAVTKGPGSFTGIRIALSAAMGFLIANKNLKPIVLDSFIFYHHRAAQQVQEFDYNVVLLSAYRDSAYVSIKDKANRLLLEPALLNKEQIISLLQQNAPHKVVCSGNYLDKIYKDIMHFENVTLLPRFRHINARILCSIAYDKLRSSNIDTSLEAYYIAFPSATIPT